MSRRAVYDVSIVMLFGNLTVIPGAHFAMCVQCALSPKKLLVYPYLAMTCLLCAMSFAASAYLDLFLFNAIVFFANLWLFILLSL